MAQQVESKNRATSSEEARQQVRGEVQDGGDRVDAPLVHRPRGAPEELRDHARRARRRARRRDGLRRLVDHRLQRDRGVGHGRDPRPGHVRRHAVALGRVEGRPDDLRRRHARRQAVRGRPALRAPPRARPDEGHGLRHVQRRPRARVLPVQGQQGDRDARRGRLLRDDDAGRGDRAAQRDDPGAREGRHPDRVPPPRGRPVPARDRHALRDARSTWPTTRSPTGCRQGDRGEERCLRDVHAEADLRRERLGDAHAPVALHGRAERLLRRGATSGTSPTSARRSSPASSATRARSPRCSRSG